LRVKSVEEKPERTSSWKAPAALAFLRDFQHWNVVAQCAVPFLIIGVLVGAATFVKKKLGDASAPVSTPTVQADPDAWQKMTDLTKADIAVRDRMKELAAAHAYAAMVQQTHRQMAHDDTLQSRSAEEQMQRAQNALIEARKRFESAVSDYQRLGGTVDYRSQAQKY
jgi:uncharacterized membrane protein